MNSESSLKLYNDLGVKPVINALGGNMTLLGGSILSPRVNAAMELANRYYVQMEELLDKSGEIIAEYFGAEAAYVTPGCAAALVLGAAACMAETDIEKIERLPDVTGSKHEIIIQKRLRYKYDRCLTVPGAKLVEVGDASGTTADQLEAAIGPNTVAITHLAPGVGDGIVSLEEVIKTGKEHGLPIIVDAAAQVYPLEILKKYTGMGADIVCYGAKYFGSPHSTGVLCGRRDLVESVKRQGFIGFETHPYRSIGRPLKVDRQEIIGVVIALQEWVAMDHLSRIESYDRRVRNLQKGFQGVAHVKAMPQQASGPAESIRLTFDEKAVGKSVIDIADALREGNPRILVRTSDDTITISTRTILDGDEEIIADRLKGLL